MDHPPGGPGVVCWSPGAWAIGEHVHMRAGWIWALIAMAVCTCCARGQQLLSPLLTGDEPPFSSLDIAWITRVCELDAERRQLCAEVLAQSRTEMVAAQRELLLANWKNEVAAPESDDAKTHEAALKRWQEFHGRFCDRREKIERSFLSDLRTASGASDEAWRRYLSHRTMFALRLGADGLGADIEALLRSIPLTSAERAAADLHIRELYESMEKPATELLRLRAIYNEKVALIERTGDWENPKVASMYAELEKLSTRRQAEVQRLSELVARGVKVICADLSPENAAEFQRLLDVCKLQSAAQMMRMLDDSVVADLLRISTLSKEQRAAMRAQVRRAQSEGAVQFKPIIAAYEAWASGKEFDGSADFDNAGERQQKIMRDLREKLMAELTPAQREAFEAGLEPPLGWSARRAGEEVERER